MLETNFEQDQRAYREMCTRLQGPSGSEVFVECDKLIEGRCSSYARPYSRFRIGGCALCSIPSSKFTDSKRKVNALKASKRAARGK